MAKPADADDALIRRALDAQLYGALPTILAGLSGLFLVMAIAKLMGLGEVPAPLAWFSLRHRRRTLETSGARAPAPLLISRTSSSTLSLYVFLLI